MYRAIDKMWDTDKEWWCIPKLENRKLCSFVGWGEQLWELVRAMVRGEDSATGHEAPMKVHAPVSREPEDSVFHLILLLPSQLLLCLPLSKYTSEAKGLRSLGDFSPLRSVSWALRRVETGKKCF